MKRPDIFTLSQTRVGGGRLHEGLLLQDYCYGIHRRIYPSMRERQESVASRLDTFPQRMRGASSVASICHGSLAEALLDAELVCILIDLRPLMLYSDRLFKASSTGSPA